MRTRLDHRLVDLGLVQSREKAKRLILAGSIRINGRVAAKASDWVVADTKIEIITGETYVSRGGLKLEAAIKFFQINCNGIACVDIGSSTGGFTDCLLQHGARKVHAVDVGKGQLHWQLRKDERVVIHERLNARDITPRDIGEPVELVTIDVSFISLKKILPAAYSLLVNGGKMIALIKPQFEAGRDKVSRGGVVRDPSIHEKVKNDISTFAKNSLNLRPVGLVDSPLRGPAGNKVFLILLETC